MKTVISLWNSFQLIGVFLCVLPVISSRSLINACASRCRVRCARPPFMRRHVHTVRRTRLHAANESRHPYHEGRVSGATVTNRRQSGFFVVSQPVVENVVMLRKQSCDLQRTRLVRESTSFHQQHNTAHLADINPDVSVFVMIVPSPCLLPVAPVATERARRGAGQAPAAAARRRLRRRQQRERMQRMCCGAVLWRRQWLCAHYFSSNRCHACCRNTSCLLAACAARTAGTQHCEELHHVASRWTATLVSHQVPEAPAAVHVAHTLQPATSLAADPSLQPARSCAAIPRPRRLCTHVLRAARDRGPRGGYWWPRGASTRVGSDRDRVGLRTGSRPSVESGAGSVSGQWVRAINHYCATIKH